MKINPKIFLSLFFLIVLAAGQYGDKVSIIKTNFSSGEKSKQRLDSLLNCRLMKLQGDKQEMMIENKGLSDIIRKIDGK